MSFLKNVYYEPGTEGVGGRSMGMWTQSDTPVSVLLEWRSPVPADFAAYVAKIVENIPTDEDVNRPEEIRTLKFEGLFNAGPRTALVYQCPRSPVNLRDVLLHIKKPSGEDRRALACIVATQIRSLYYHCRLRHTALRTESFVFFGGPDKLDLTNPYVLGWGCPSSPSIYQHPEFQTAQPVWFYDVWSLMIVLSEIAEWQPVEGSFQDERELLRKKLERKQRVMDPNWKGAPTATIFQYGFGFLEKDRHSLEKLSKKEIKRFFDRLCELLAASVAW